MNLPDPIALTMERQQFAATDTDLTKLFRSVVRFASQDGVSVEWPTLEAYVVPKPPACPHEAIEQYAREVKTGEREMLYGVKFFATRLAKKKVAE